MFEVFFVVKAFLFMWNMWQPSSSQFVFFAFFLLSTTFGLLTSIIANIVQDSLESSRAFEKALKEIDRENRALVKTFGMCTWSIQARYT